LSLNPFLFTLSFRTVPVFAREYALKQATDNQPIVSFELPYTFGTHKGKAMNVSGESRFQMLGLRFNGRLLIPIDSLRTGTQKWNAI